jgi:hypothetical protein
MVLLPADGQILLLWIITRYAYHSQIIYLIFSSSVDIDNRTEEVIYNNLFLFMRGGLQRSEGGGSFQAVDLLNGKLLCGCDDIHACVVSYNGD